MSDDLTDPGYRPDYTGDNSLGDVGSGRELGANLYALYRAGRNELPQLAYLYYRLTSKILLLRGSLETQFERPGLGPERVHGRLLEMRDAAHAVLRQNCLRMQEVGQALVETADDYAATDQAATDEFARLLEENSEDYEYPSIEGLDPPAPDDEIPMAPY